MFTKTYLLIGFILAAVWCCTAQPRSHALLIGIGNYPADSGWNTLHADNDLGLLQQVVLPALGYEVARVKVVANAQATRANIWQALAQLEQAVQPGDRVYVHFSGHGQQIVDDNGDEVDGLDEALVSYDSPKYYDAGGYRGENLLRDDDWGAWMQRLRRKLDSRGDLFVVIDACNSGSALRGAGMARGTDVVMGSPGRVKRLSKQLSGETSGMTDDNVGDNAVRLAPQAVFYASAPHQLSWEVVLPDGAYAGPLTYALCRAMQQGIPATYRGLFDHVKAIMAGVSLRQFPLAEGQLDRRLSDGRWAAILPHANVSYWDSDYELSLYAGLLSGFTPGTTVAVFPPDIRDTVQTEPLATGTVRQSSLFDCKVELHHPIGQEAARSAWVLVRQAALVSPVLRYAITGQGANVERLRERLSAYPLISENNEATELTVTTGAAWRIDTYEGQVPWKSGNSHPDTWVEQAFEVVVGVARARLLRRLEAQSPLLQLELDFVPVTVRKNGGKSQIVERLDPALLQRGGQWRFRVGESVLLRVSNRGLRPAYFSILDIQPDEQVNLLIPAPGRLPAEYYLRPGESRELDVIMEIAPPLGPDLIKLIATETPLDLGSLAGPTRNARWSRLDRLLADPFRRGNDAALAQEIQVKTVAVVIGE